MIFHSIRWKLTFAYLLTVLISISVLGFYLSKWTDDRYILSLRNELANESLFIGHIAEERMHKGSGSVEALTKQIDRDLGRRVTIIRADGIVLGDSRHDPSTMERHNGRPEIRQALLKSSGWSIRYSDTLHSRMLYVATRIGDASHPMGVARISESLAQVDRERGDIHRVFFLAALIAFVIAAVTGARISSNIANPIHAMSAIAKQFAQGDLNQRLRVKDKSGDV